MYVVWTVLFDGVEYPIGYHVPNPAAFKQIFNGTPPHKYTGYDAVLNQTDFDRSGLVVMGTTDVLDMERLATEHPWGNFVEDFKRVAGQKPWMRDPDILSVWAANQLEGGVDPAVAQSLIQGSDWWQTHNDDERAWLKLEFEDPATAQRVLADQRLVVADALRSFGINNASDDLVNMLASKMVTGAWSTTYTTEQMRLLADPERPGDLDADLTRAGLDTTFDQVARVRGLVNQWVGPVTAAGWSNDQMQRWAGRLRNDPDAENELVTMLQQQRVAMFPAYENPQLSYEDVVAPWRSLFFREWGQQANDSDPLFTKIVNMNDVDEATKLLQREGLKRGVGTVVNRAMSDLVGTFNSVRRADPGIL